MSEFNVGDKVKIKGGSLADETIYRVEEQLEDSYVIDHDEEYYLIKNSDTSHEIRMRAGNLELVEPVSIFESYLMETALISQYESYYEMAMIAYDDKLNISVNQEMKRLSIPYFKVYDHEKYSAAKRVARLHFKDSGMEYHDDSRGKEIWEISKGDSRKIVKLMQAPSDEHEGYTNWQVACYQWNYHNGLVKNFKDYFAGKYDHIYDNDSRLKKAYVPHDQEMPKTWIYDPSKGKRR